MKKKSGKDRAWLLAEGGGGTVALVLLGVALAALLRLIRPESMFLSVLFFIAVLIGALVLIFFRDPNRKTGARQAVAVSPADGRVVGIVEEFEPVYLNERARRVSIFLSVFDVHVQRIPVGGKVKVIDHRPGRFLQAFKPEASASNEHIAMVIESAYGRILVKQIAGILARRCVNYAALDEDVKTGERFGLIKFGSRVDLFLPAGSQILVKPGERVRGGLTAVARLDAGGEHAE